MNCPRITYLHSSLLQFPVYLDITSEIQIISVLFSFAHLFFLQSPGNGTIYLMESPLLNSLPNKPKGLILFLRWDKITTALISSY